VLLNIYIYGGNSTRSTHFEVLRHGLFGLAT
jgi:hypothetical protein